MIANSHTRRASIVRYLKRNHKATAKQLAQAFETTERTILRDMEILREFDFPIVGIAGEGYRWDEEKRATQTFLQSFHGIHKPI